MHLPYHSFARPWGREGKHCAAEGAAGHVRTSRRSVCAVLRWTIERARAGGFSLCIDLPRKYSPSRVKKTERRMEHAEWESAAPVARQVNVFRFSPSARVRRGAAFRRRTFAPVPYRLEGISLTGTVETTTTVTTTTVTTTTITIATVIRQRREMM